MTTTNEEKFLKESLSEQLPDDDSVNGRFYTISEVADEIHVPQHVLRFWETRFEQVKPFKRVGGRRYYREIDLELLRYISQLLYRDGHTVKVVQRILNEKNTQLSEDKKTSDSVEVVTEKSDAESDHVLVSLISSHAEEHEELENNANSDVVSAGVSEQITEQKSSPEVDASIYLADFQSEIISGSQQEKVENFHEQVPHSQWDESKDHTSSYVANYSDSFEAQSVSEGFENVSYISKLVSSEESAEKIHNLNAYYKNELNDILFELEALRDIFLHKKQQW